MTSDLRSALIDDVTQSLRLAGAALETLTDDEFWWEPVEGCWTVKRAGEEVPGALPAMGEWTIDGLFTNPQPAPFTTIGWRLNHMIVVLAGYYDLLGPAPGDIFITGSAAESVETWHRMAERYRETVGALRLDDALELVDVEHWGRAVKRWTIVGHVMREQIHHSAEIGCLRDLRRGRP